jgi:filamentous hemagglutinin
METGPSQRIGTSIPFPTTEPPPPSFDAFIDNANGGTAYTVTLNSDITVNSLTINVANATLLQTSGTFQAGTATISAGTYQVNGGTIKGGNWTISGTGSMKFNGSGNNVLDNVSLTGAIDLSASSSYVRLINGTNFTAVASLSIGSNSTLGLGQASFDNANITLHGNSAVAIEGSQSVTLGTNVTISQAANSSGNIGQSFVVSGTDNLDNHGVIEALNTGSTITISPTGAFTNSGTLSAAGGGTINVNAGSATAPNFTNAGILKVDTGGTINLNGSYTTAGLNLASIQRLNSGGTINIQGKLDNTVGGPLALTAQTGSLRLSGGTIAGGSISGSGGRR